MPLVLTGLAVAFAFRCGLFNIGGQGQYIAGSIAAVLIATELPKRGRPAPCPAHRRHRARRDARGCGAGRIAGFLKATVGAHEVITTIMLNWIVIWVGVVPLRHRRPVPDAASDAVPSSEDVPEAAKLSVFWGDPLLQGLHIGLFVALAALVVYS